MSTRIKIIIAGVMIAGTTGIISCNEPQEKKAEKVEEAEYKIVTVEPEPEISKSDPAIEYNAFRAEADRVIAENELKMKELQKSMLTRKSDVRIQYEKDLALLKIENQKLKATLDAFTYETTENWVSFKSTVNQEIDRIGKSISAIAEKADKGN